MALRQRAHDVTTDLLLNTDRRRDLVFARLFSRFTLLGTTTSYENRVRALFFRLVFPSDARSVILGNTCRTSTVGVGLYLFEFICLLLLLCCTAERTFWICCLLCRLQQLQAMPLLKVVYS